MTDPGQRRLAVGLAAVLVLGIGAFWLVDTARWSSDPSVAAPVPLATATPAAAVRREAPADEAARASAALALAEDQHGADGVPAAAVAIELRGRVVDGGHTPVAGARVVLQRRFGDEFLGTPQQYWEIETVATAVTDADGRFAFAVERARPYRLRADAGGAPAVRTGCFGGDDVELELRAGVGLRGVVVDGDTGAPIVGAGVLVWTGAPLPVALGRVRSGSDGTFAFADCPAGHLGVAASADGYAEATDGREVAPGGETVVELRLRRAQLVRGWVRDAVSAAPIGGATVVVDVRERWSAQTDARGRFELALGDSPIVRARAEGYATGAADVTDPALEILIELQRGAAVRGRFVLPASVAAGSIRVSAQRPLGAGRRRYLLDLRPAHAAADGSFVLGDLAAADDWSIVAEAPGCARLVVAVPPLRIGDRADLGELHLEVGAVVDGRVVDAAGAPVVAAYVDMQPDDAAAPAAARRYTTADDRGCFHFAGVGPGSWRLRAALAGTIARREPIAVTAGDVVRDVELRFAGGLSIRGHLARPDGTAERSWHLIAASEREGVHQDAFCTVAADGSFALEPLQPGTYRVDLFDGPDGCVLPSTHGVAAGTGDLQLVAQTALWTEVQAVDAGDRPLVGARVAIKGSTIARDRECGQTDTAGHCRIALVPGETCRLHVFSVLGEFVVGSADGLAAGTATIRVRCVPP